jgi:O-antigen/teichoic acid export membrane protein
MITCRLVGQAAQVGVLLILARHLSQVEFGTFMTALAIQGHALVFHLRPGRFPCFAFLIGGA